MRSIFVLLMFVFLGTLKAQTFTNIAPSQGIIASASGNYGNGVSLYDWNKDGYDDITLNSSVAGPRFFQNNNGVFTEVFFSGLSFIGDCKAINWVDMNNDGFPDISFNSYLGKLRFFMNNGNFQFTEISLSCGITQEALRGYALSWADYNKDGFLDVYVSNYMDSTVINASTNFLYKNNGDGTFEDVSISSGTDNGYHYTLQSIWFDYDNDSWPDLFVNNDRSVHRNYLYHNNGNGTFSEVGIQAGIGLYFDAMSASVADYNNDGWFDIYITDTPGTGNYLFRNNGNGTFTNVAASNNVTSGQFSWGAVWLDADNNKLQDLFVASMPYLPSSYPGYNSFFKNYGNTFDPLYSTGLTVDAGSTFSCARGDFNNDGFPDLLTHSYAPLGTQIWQNNGGAGHYIKVGLQGVYSNEDAVGTRIELYAGGAKQFRYTFCGEQYISQNSQWQHFGLGTTTSIDSLVIRWPRGHVDAYYNLSIDESHLFVEGETLHATVSAIGDTTFCEGDSLILSAGNWTSYVWSTGETTPSITVTESGDYSVMVFNGMFYIQSDTIHIEVHANPIVTANVNPLLCSDAYYGSIELVTNQQGSVLWNDGATSLLHEELVIGEYAYTFTSEFGCQVSGQAEMYQIPNPFYSSTHISTVSCPGNWSAEINATGGALPYTYLMELYYQGSTEPFMVFTDSSFDCLHFESNVDLFYSVVDANGCSAQGNMTLGYILAIDEHENDPIQVYPNPVEDVLTISSTVDIEEIVVYDSSGRLLLSTQYSTNCQFNDLSPGWYLLEIKIADRKHYRSVLKK